MASQPLNTSIKIYRTLRSERGGLRHESIKALTARLRPAVLQIPGAETAFVGSVSRDASTKGSTPYDEMGRPIVIGVRNTTNFSVYENFSGIDFPFAIAGDEFIRNTAAGLNSSAQSDLFKVARTVAGVSAT